MGRLRRGRKEGGRKMWVVWQGVRVTGDVWIKLHEPELAPVAGTGST
jgi:hypothetical protein